MSARKTAAKRAPRKKSAEADYVLILRTCNADMRSHNDFQWPTSGVVKAPDWKPTKACGNGLHELLWGAGNGSLLDWGVDAKWIVAKVRADSTIDLSGKVKFPEAEVIYAGDRKTATDMIAADSRAHGAIVGSTLTGGDGSTLTGGHGSTLTGGDGSTLTGGDGSTLTGGDRSTLTGGDRSTLTGGGWSTLTGGYGSTLTGGHGSTLTGGYGSTLTGGHGSELRARWYDNECNRYRTAIAYVGENGIKPGVKYCLNDKHEFVEVKP